MLIECSNCDGEGLVEDKYGDMVPCEECNGTGLIEKLTVEEEMDDDSDEDSDDEENQHA